MVSERTQRQIERLLDQAETAFEARDWEHVRSAASDALSLNPDNVDARNFTVAAERNLGEQTRSTETAGPTAAPSLEQPASFVNGRYEVRRFLGEGGKKRVYLAHDALLDRDVAFALIKTEGLDAAGARAHPARGADDGPPRRAPAHRDRLRPGRGGPSTAQDSYTVHRHRAHGRR